jgi:transcriptional regulator with XRE-family HTH domain
MHHMLCESCSRYLHPMRRVLVDRGITQRKLAHIADVGEADVSRVLNGHAPGSPEFRRRVAAALKMRQRELFDVEQ